MAISQATPEHQAAADPRAFYDGLVEELSAMREAVSVEEKSFGGEQLMEGPELREWLKFQAWYEQQAAHFIGSWLKHTHEDDAFIGLCQQVADEGKHYKLLISHLRSMGDSLDGWEPEPEYVDWVVDFYASGEDTIERVAAHNITGELGALQAFETLMPRIPENTQRVLNKILPDEKFHVQLGRMVVERYATTVDAQRRVRARVIKAFELEQKGRIAFDRRMRQVMSAA